MQKTMRPLSFILNVVFGVLVGRCLGGSESKTESTILGIRHVYIPFHLQLHLCEFRYFRTRTTRLPEKLGTPK